MHSLTGIILIILIACLLPYVFAALARIGSGYKPEVHGGAPRIFMAKTNGWSARAYAVQQNSFEGLPLFLVAIMMAEYLVIPDGYILLLGSAYILLRLIYGILYLADLPQLRSVFWLLATACPIILLVLCMKVY